MDIDTSTSRRALLSGALGIGGLAALSPAGPAAAAPIPADPSSGYYLKLDGIPGESTSTGHAGEIDLLTWSFGVTSAGSPLAAGGGGGAGKSKPSDFVFVARTSKASPKLFQTACTGKHLKSAVLSVVRNGESGIEYLTVTLENVMVTSYQVAPGETDGYPLDVVHLAYSKIHYSYRPQNPDGSAGTPVTVGFDFGAHKSV